jgi:hypothetical protein
VSHNKKIRDGVKSAAVEKQLRAYALAAAAAGAGVLTLSGPAQASVVYNPVQISLSDGRVNIDLNGDGIIDFALVDRDKFTSGVYSNRILGVVGMAGASVVKASAFAAALVQNDPISSGQTFEPVSQGRGKMASIGYNCMVGSTCQSFKLGPWRNVKNNYLGFKFQLNGETHFGWARINVASKSGSGGTSKIKIYLSGYAYETTPNMPINAGQTTGSEAQGSLGHLARGAAK